MIKAIQTTYAGHKFRSRLEARWCVFFNAAGIKWQYECEGFQIGDKKYLPDFRLPEPRLWVEVKGDWSAETDEYLDLLNQFGNEESGLLLLGPIPTENKFAAIHPFIRNGKLGWVTTCHGALRFLEPTIDFSVSELRERLNKQIFCANYNNTEEKQYRLARMARFEFGETPKC